MKRMRKKLVAIGNSLGIVIEKPILELLGMDRDTELDVTTDGQRLILSASRAPRVSTPVRRHGPNEKGFANLDFPKIRDAPISFSPAVVQSDGTVRNPKRGDPRKRFAKYEAGMSVAEALAAGVTEDDIRWDVEHNFIVLSESKPRTGTIHE